MSRILTRRAALGAALTAPLAGVLPAHAASNSPTPASTGFFTVPEEGVLIGLLLPAVQAAREAARLHLLDSRGKLALTIPLSGGQPTFFDVFFGDGSVTPAENQRTLIVKQRGGRLAWEIPTLDGILIGLLLPAVQKNGSSAGFLAASVQLHGGNGQVAGILPFIEQNNLVNGDGRGDAGPSFVGPFSLSAGQQAQIGLLLPAVQKVREAAARTVILNGDGKLIAQDQATAPEGSSGPYTAFYDLFFGDGSVRVERRMGDGSVRVGEGSSPDGILIGLLLPAVQNADRAAGLLGGSLQLPGATVAFQDLHR